MKKPKLLKLPKMPKSRTPAALEKYAKRLEATHAANKRRLAPYEAAKKKVESIRDRIQKLREKGV
ncbi:MAG: hypothetical protein F9K24_20725 [Leptonema illini]|uniref:Uncharacterized protein n=1 Tax=Leptonema illini TaxID=183 RepID=A0A833GZ01_9LEPT|nr:MAG: hypothetical protein F9K24_20725 [Leptonema illini]